jgi:hypothetical protein
MEGGMILADSEEIGYERRYDKRLLTSANRYDHRCRVTLTRFDDK